MAVTLEDPYDHDIEEQGRMNQSNGSKINPMSFEEVKAYLNGELQNHLSRAFSGRTLYADLGKTKKNEIKAEDIEFDRGALYDTDPGLNNPTRYDIALKKHKDGKSGTDRR